MAYRRQIMSIAAIGLTFVVLLVGCDNGEQKVRDTLAILDDVPEGNEAALDTAYEEAKANALLISNTELRLRLTTELDSRYSSRKEPFEAARREAEIAKQQAAEEARRQRELEQARQLAEIELERKRRELELEEKQRSQAQVAALALSAAAASSQEAKIYEGIRDIEIGTRTSLMNENTKVLILRNIKPYSLDFYLKCFTRGGSSKTMFVSVPAHGSKEIGFLEGWDGNFVSGERCEAIYDDEVVWNVRIP